MEFGLIKGVCSVGIWESLELNEHPLPSPGPFLNLFRSSGVFALAASYCFLSLVWAFRYSLSLNIIKHSLNRWIPARQIHGLMLPLCWAWFSRQIPSCVHIKNLINMDEWMKNLWQWRLCNPVVICTDLGLSLLFVELKNGLSFYKIGDLMGKPKHT